MHGLAFRVYGLIRLLVFLALQKVHTWVSAPGRRYRSVLNPKLLPHTQSLLKLPTQVL